MHTKNIFHSICISILCCLTFNSFARSEVQVPYDTSRVTLDGKLDDWKNTPKTLVTVGTGQNVTVYARHDGHDLYFAFSGIFEDGIGMPLFPEVLIDHALKKGNKWVSGMWWFHVSKTDCESNGDYGVYNNCLEDHKDWHAAPNWGPAPKAVEIRIPFSKIGIDPAKIENIGMAFVLTNTMSTWKIWPTGADHLVPSTWGTATLGTPNTR